MPTYSKIHISYNEPAASIYARAARAVFFAWIVLFGTLPAQADMQLYMFDEVGCTWCAQWTAEVGPEYPITPEGLAAPLVRININDPLPDALELRSPPRFTPTFILVAQDAEVGRIEGYPGEDFFWGLLGRLLAQAEAGS